MDYIIKNESELDAALASAVSGDTLKVAGRVKLSKKISLDGACGLSFVGDGGAFDLMREVGGFTETTMNGVRVFIAEIPDELAEMKPYMAFTADGTMLHRPRLPKSGYYRVKAAPGENMFETPQFDGQAGLIYNPGEVPVMKYPETAQIRAFHWWTDELCYIGEIDYEACAITFTHRSVFAMRCENSKTVGCRWYLDNVFEALDTPGEYFITPDYKTIYYVPHETDTADGFTLQVSTAEQLLDMKNCRDISFAGIEFKGSDRDKLWLWRKHSQAASDVPCAMNLDCCAGIRFDSCRFVDIGLSCVGIDNGSHDIDFDSCEFAGIGGNAIYIKGRNVTAAEWKMTYPKPNKNERNPVGDDILHDINVRGCHICDYGRVYYNACGILLHYAYSCELSENHIHDGYYTGISAGWIWGYAPHATHHLKIENNHIHDIGKALLSDMGGIYTLGHQEGTVIRGNLIHNIEMDSYGGWAVYLDEGSSDILVERNVCYDLTAQPFHQHYGANNHIRENIFAFGEGGAVRVSVKEEHLSAIFERNIFVSDGTAIIAGSPGRQHIINSMNLIWDYSGEPKCGLMNYDVYTRTYTFPKENQYKMDELDDAPTLYIAADPLFVDAKNRDLRLDPASPALKLGFDWAVKK